MNQNKVELIGYYGSDITHAQSAWTSTNRELSQDKTDRIPGLLKMLAENGHHTPYEKSSIHFLVTTEIATHIQLLKSRIGCSVNSESARYKELKEDKYYLPDDWKDVIVPDQISNVNNDWYYTLEKYTKIGNDLYHKCLTDLTPILGRKRAKESARYFKTYNSQITADVMFNFRSFNHFLSLRMKPDAQKEIRELSEQMLTLVKNIEGNPFKYTLEAFGL